MIYHIWLSIKARSFFFFTASNPGIETGGMLGESKSAILSKIPSDYKASFFVVDRHQTEQELVAILEKLNFTFPVIAKPDVGERGQGVKKINSLYELRSYKLKTRAKFIVQEYIDFPLELGVFYHRFPDHSNGLITSVVMKEFLSVTGDGISTLRQLIENYPRARFVKEYLLQQFENQLDHVLPLNSKLELEGIGNHVRGTTFLDATNLINDKLNFVFDTISLSIDGFFYGRYDLRCSSIEDLYEGKNIKILELNGCGAEPAHIYQPGFPFFKGQKILLSHHHLLFKISMANHRNGVPFYSFLEIKKAYKQYKSDIQNI